MTDTEVHVEHEHSRSEVESAIEEVEEKAENHVHPEYSPAGHSHPEADHSERIALLESRIENIEHGLAEEVEEPVVEEIEPTEEHHEAPAEEHKRRKHRFGGR